MCCSVHPLAGVPGAAVVRRSFFYCTLINKQMNNSHTKGINKCLVVQFF
jgi:hypothetical protein